MSKRIARLALALGAAAALAGPTTQANAAPSCSPTIEECLKELLSSIATPHVECVPVYTYIDVCPPSGS